jgi:predicted nucleic acid-binding protein
LPNLAAIGQSDLLLQLCGRLHIAQAVWEELNAKGQNWPGRDEVATADWIERHTVQNQAVVTALRRDLNKGEGETIALALELGADLVLLERETERNQLQAELRYLEAQQEMRRLTIEPAAVQQMLMERKETLRSEDVKPR